MISGVSTASLYPLETEKAIRTLGELGIRNIEIFVSDISELRGEIRREMLSYISDYDMYVAAVHPFSSPLETLYLFSDYKRRVNTIFEIYREYFNFASAAGSELFVMHGAQKDAIIADEQYIERYLMLCDAAAEFGVTVAQENVHYCKSGSIAFLEYMQRACGGRAKFVLDIKQALRAGVAPEDIVRAVGRDIVHLHVSDNRPGADCLPVGEGTYDLAGLLRELKAVGFDGALLVELYRKNYTEYSELSESVKRIEYVIKELQ